MSTQRFSGLTTPSCSAERASRLARDAADRRRRGRSRPVGGAHSANRAATLPQSTVIAGHYERALPSTRRRASRSGRRSAVHRADSRGLGPPRGSALAHRPARGDSQGPSVPWHRPAHCRGESPVRAVLGEPAHGRRAQASYHRGDDRRSVCEVHESFSHTDLGTWWVTPQWAVRTRWSALPGVRVGFGLRPRQHIRRAGPTRQWER